MGCDCLDAVHLAAIDRVLQDLGTAIFERMGNSVWDKRREIANKGSYQTMSH